MTKNIVITAPDRTEFEDDEKTTTIFLAGTIDGGDSEDWQKEICDAVLKTNGNKRRIVIFNPRRAEWPDDEGEIVKQIKWELDHLEKADVIIMHIAKDSKSPISLLEMGLFVKSGKLFVSCPEGFYRFDNVKVTCERYGAKLVTDYTVDDLVREIVDFASSDGLSDDFPHRRG